MWGSWISITLGAAAVVVFLVAIAFGTFAVPLAIGIAVVLGIGALFASAIYRRAAEGSPAGSGGPADRGRRGDGAPVSGEGSTPPSSSSSSSQA